MEKGGRESARTMAKGHYTECVGTMGCHAQVEEEISSDEKATSSQ